MRKFLIAAGLAFALPACAANDEPPAATAAAPTATAPARDADPALWVVRDADTTIYLFGTFHLLDGRAWFDDEIRNAFDASGELVLEALIPENPADLAPLVVRYAIDPEGRALSSLLTAEQNAKLARALGEAGIPAVAFERMEPWFVSMTLATLAAQRLGINSDQGPETVLSRAARQRGIGLHELEGMEWQLRMLDSMPEAQQLAQLRETLDKLDELHESLAPMLAAWSAGDVATLQRLLTASSVEDPEVHRMMFTNRNETWAGWISERLSRPGTVFLAVGAGHLAGRGSVQARLQARGIEASRVASED